MVALLLVNGGIAPAQATLPVTAPTAQPQAGVNVGAADAAATGAGVPVAASAGHPAEVHSVGGKVEVVADGSSLNQILREIGRVTGMKITGDVADEPVYGRYGPGPASEILSALLDGTASNMLLREATAAGPGELILTPRTGGVTPPDPNAKSSQDGYVPPNVPGSPNYQRPREQLHLENVVPPYGRGSQPGSDTGQGTGPTERPNPQQIYQQLQRMQQTQPQPQTPQGPQQ
jgi:hypothetical protein